MAQNGFWRTYKELAYAIKGYNQLVVLAELKSLCEHCSKVEKACLVLMTIESDEVGRWVGHLL